MALVRVQVGAEAPLLEREGELAALSRSLDGVTEGRAGFVLVLGPAGIGKTRLLGALAEGASAAGFGVLRAGGAEFERELPFGGAAQLFEASLRGLTDRTRAAILGEGAARLAGELLGFAPGGPVDHAADRSFAVVHGLYWLCVNLAARRPLVLLIDDAHWLDEPSVGWLEYLVRRREGLPLVVVAATRPEEALGRRLLNAAMDTDGTLLEPRPLSVDAVRQLLEATLQDAPATEFSEAFQDATGGNPFLVHELLRTVRHEGLAPDGRGARTIQTLGSDRIGRAVLVRLHRLSPAAVELARAVAILGRAGSLSVAARLADLDVTVAAPALEALVAAEVFAPGTELRFRHSVVQASIYDDLPASARAFRHRRAAGVLAGMGAPNAEVAGQLLEAEPAGEPWAVDVLRSAALEATSRGAPSSALALLERAVAEIPAAEDPDLLLELGRAAVAALDIPKAIEALTRARATAAGALRATAVLELARVLFHAGPAHEAIGLMQEELDRSDVDPELRVWLELESALVDDRRDERVPRHFESLPGGNLAELAALGVAAWAADTADEAASLARRALAGGTLIHALDAAEPWFLAPWMLVRADRLGEAEGVVAQALERSRTIGSQSGFARSSWLTAEIDYRKGDLLGAEANALSAYSIGVKGGSLWIHLMSGALLAQILADRGNLDDAARILDTLDISTVQPTQRLTRTVHYGAAYVALAAGRPAEALAALASLNDSLPESTAWRARFPTGMVIQTIALSTLGRFDEARKVADEELAWAESWGAPRFVGMALRGRAQTVADTDRVETLQSAVDILVRTRAKLELARALGDLGSTLRRQNQRAASREPLRRGLDLARHCRADLLAEQLRGELRAAGARPRREVLTGTDSLTASESRIAEMAAAGMTNLQIGQSLFLTPGTVEKHLTNVYAKLGIQSRHQLVSALRSDPET
jgi:DNA-binding CsgD family transcriptional regulator